MSHFWGRVQTGGCPRTPDGTSRTSGTSKTDDCGKKGAARDEGERSLASRISGRARWISRHFAECLEGAEECLAAAPTFRGMLAGTGLFWHRVSDTRCQFGGDNLGVAVEGQNGQRPGDAPEPPMGWQADGR